MEHFWLKLNEHIRGTVPKVKIAHVPVMCQHCDDAPCITVCPVENAIYQREDGLVIIDPTKCTGCKRCIAGCPYGCIYFNDDLNLAQKCTGCAHLLDRGWPITEPRCVDACPTEVIKFGEEADFQVMIAQAEILHPEYGLKPRAYYMNLPKRFIAGTVYNPDTEEVAIGATCTLSGDGSGTVATDTFGDFWFEGLEVGTYSLIIAQEALPGEATARTKTISDISTEKDVNLGDIPLS